MRLRLILSFALVVLVSVTGVVLITRQGAVSEVRAFMYRGGMTGEDGLVSALEEYYQAHGSWEGAEALLASPGGMHGRGQGNSSAQGGGMMMGQRLRLADADGNLAADTSAASATGRLSSAEKRAAIPLEVDGRTVGYLLAEGGMGYSRSDEIELLNRLNNAALTAGLIAGGLSLLLALLLAYRLLRPVRQLTGAARKLGEGDLSQRVEVSGGDELSVLAGAFNRMADSLQQAEEGRRALTADIAHELRNPLAVQRANLEALQDGIYPLAAESLAPILEQNLLLTRLVDDLRTLALAEAGQLKLERTSTDLVSLAGKIVERFKHQAASHEVDLRLEHPAPDLTVCVDPMRVEQILSNLLSNALRYTPQGGQIVVGLQSTPRGAQLSVHDSGPGIPVEALPRLFERFYRGDRSRSRSEGGTGLGLAIARQLAEAHSGTLTAANHPQGGALFVLELPVQQPDQKCVP
ncbi:MAG: HAMP domain-containing protein [Anaerolineales bacterium]|nr:HAMP domain-containing protein [Anaerolineales bacterium]